MRSHEATKLLFDWSKLDWPPRHRVLLQKHGLVDSFGMSAAISGLAHRSSALLQDNGDPVLADWILQSAAFAHALLLPRHIADLVWVVCSWKWDGQGPRQWLVMWDAVFDHLAHLEYLDVNMGLSPSLWIDREAVSLDARTRRMAERQAVRVFYGNMMWEDCCWNRANEQSGTWEYGWMLGMEPCANRWWEAETWAAATLLASFSPAALRRAIRGGDVLQPGGEHARKNWDVVYRKRQATLRYGGNTDRGEEQDPVVAVRLPELGAIPFYHVDQLTPIYEAIWGGQLVFSLLGDLSDADFRRGRIADLRAYRGYPRTETRGRRPRDARIVQRVRAMEREGISKYQISKLLGIPRSTVYDYLKKHDRLLEGEESGGHHPSR